MPHCVGQHILDTKPNDLNKEMLEMEQFKKGSKSAACTTNQYRDYAKRMSKKWNRWGQQVEYGLPKTKVIRNAPCDPLNPDKCPKDLPVCL